MAGRAAFPGFPGTHAGYQEVFPGDLGDLVDRRPYCSPDQLAGDMGYLAGIPYPIAVPIAILICA